MDDGQAACTAPSGADPPEPAERPPGRTAPWPGDHLSTMTGGRDGLAVALVDEGSVRVVTVAGQLDHDSAYDFRLALARPVADGIELVLVDLGDLCFCDATGLNLLLRPGRAARSGHRRERQRTGGPDR
ncbi:STAS domain-containing protein [Kitasatospora sp. NPDC085464]|uniref:STAS domain-containing protein n=1 Tax=Kitasatospora sp. NPDC085464 TaxID=3364063 RepID=UPI0037C9989A